MKTGEGLGLRTYRRTVVAGIATAVLVIASFGSAQERSVLTGNTKATAIVARVAPGVGSLQLAITAGSAVAETKNALAQAQSQALDLGLIGTTLTGEGCDGGEGTLTAEQLPQPERVDNRDGPAAATSDEVPAEGSPIGGGRKEAEATEQPSAHAGVTVLPAELGPVLSIGAGRADSTAQVSNGTREARATVGVDLDIAGLVQLKGLYWEALHRTGAEEAAEGSFGIAKATALDLPLPLDALGTVEDAVNGVLAATGISIDFPEVRHITEPTDLVRVTPLRIVLKDTPIGDAVLGPVLELTREQREQLFDEIVAAFCTAASALLVGDVGLSVASGTGFLAVEVGGVEATTQAIEIGNPFGNGTPRDLDVEPPQTEPVLEPRSAPPPTGAEPANPALQQAVSEGPTEEVCESAHPFNWPPCSKGAALPLGLVGLGLTSAFAVLDWRHQRRRLDVGEG